MKTETFASIFDSALSVVADRIEDVRDGDVYTMLEYCHVEHRYKVGEFLSCCRPDLEEAVQSTLDRLG